MKANYMTKDVYDVIIKAQITRYFIDKKARNKMTVA